MKKILMIVCSCVLFGMPLMTMAETCAELLKNNKGDGNCKFKANCVAPQKDLGTADCKVLLKQVQTCCLISFKDDLKESDVPKVPSSTDPTAQPAGKAAAPTVISLKDPLGGIGISGIGIIGALARLITTFLGIIGALALLVFVYAGTTYMTAGGSEERVTHAVNTMKYAFIGLALITFAYTLAHFFLATLTT